jgi:hypothetical protein
MLVPLPVPVNVVLFGVGCLVWFEMILFGGLEVGL